MAENSRRYLTWAAELGTPPLGRKGQVDRYGEFEGHQTYLDDCDCSNPNCKALIARYADSDELCSTQTLALRHEAAMLLDSLIKLRGRLDEAMDAHQSMLFLAINDPIRVAMALTGFWNLSNVLPGMLQEVVMLKAAVVATQAVHFYVEVSEETGLTGEKYRVEPCPSYRWLLEQERLKTPALASGLENDDPAKKISQELPEGENFYDDDLLSKLFNGKLGGSEDGED